MLTLSRTSARFSLATALLGALGLAVAAPACAGPRLAANVERLRLDVAAAARDAGVVTAGDDDLVELFVLAELVVGDHGGQDFVRWSQTLRAAMRERVIID